MKNAPLLIDYLDEESKNDFKVVKEYLTKIGIPFEVDSALVRGLDYYTKTTFEVISNKVGSQSALCGGGRYDLLIEELGGKPTPGVGFAAGMERILLACENENSFTLPDSSIDVYLIRIDKGLESTVAEIGSLLRSQKLSVEFDYLNRSTKAQMREANKLNAKYVLFIGGDEYSRGELLLKNMADGQQKIFKKDEINKIISEVK
jgi:histidyl-tRNA synthetase